MTTLKLLRGRAEELLIGLPGVLSQVFSSTGLTDVLWLCPLARPVLLQGRSVLVLRSEPVRWRPVLLYCLEGVFGRGPRSLGVRCRLCARYFFVFVVHVASGVCSRLGDALGVVR